MGVEADEVALVERQRCGELELPLPVTSTPTPLSEQAFDLAGVDVVVNTHLHFDHCGGNHLFAGRPIYVQRQELEDGRTEDD
jgi:glyoxylase-like metal-dependent hydrolase (beta-lactamase superfamily II)